MVCSISAPCRLPQHALGRVSAAPTSTRLHDKAAALMESLVRNHPFIDGNKRTAITSAGLFLQRNGLYLHATQETLYEFTMRMATGEADLPEAGQWLRQHTRVR